MANIGIEWINNYHGYATNLSHNDENARGFYNTLDGIRSFEWGNDWAWDKDFEEQGAGLPPEGTDVVWADNVDICFFSGHGSTSGPFFGVQNMDSGTARPSEMRLGNKQLEWIVFDACHVLNYGGGDVFGRIGWPVFKGLHYMLGFDTSCHDVTSRGKRFAKYLNQGYKVSDAWIKACKSTESSSTKWAVMRAENTNIPTNTANDHWWGKGYVSLDPTNPTQLTISWGSC